MSFDPRKNPSLGTRKEVPQCGGTASARSGTSFGLSRTARPEKEGTVDERRNRCGEHQYARSGTSCDLSRAARTGLERSGACGEHRSGRSGTSSVPSPAAKAGIVDQGLGPEGFIDRLQAFWVVGFVCRRALYLTAHAYEEGHSIQEEVSDRETVEARHGVAPSRSDCAQEPRGKGGSRRSLRGAQGASPGEEEPSLQGQDSAGGPARSRDRAGLAGCLADQAAPQGWRGSGVVDGRGTRGLHREDGRAREPGDHAADRPRPDGQANESPRTPTASAGRSPSPPSGLLGRACALVSRRLAVFPLFFALRQGAIP